MTILTDQETAELQRKIEALADTLPTPTTNCPNNETHAPEWKKHFRIDTDLQGIKSLLAEKRKKLLYVSLPAWRQDEATDALAKVEVCVQKLEAKASSVSYTYSIVKETVTTVLDDTLAEIKRGEIFTGVSASALQAVVHVVDKRDVFDAVMQRANLEALDSEIVVKKHVVAALAGLLQREMVRSIDTLAGY